MPGVKAPEQERRAQILDAAVRVATADRLDGLTVRKVAEAAELSPGLVFFHFGTKDQLLLDLLDRVLEEIIGRRPPEDAAGAPSARDALLAYARRELERLPGEREFVELFFDFWVVGTRNPDVRTRMSEAMAAYRASFEPLATRIVAEEADRFDGVPPPRRGAHHRLLRAGHRVPGRARARALRRRRAHGRAGGPGARRPEARAPG